VSVPITAAEWLEQRAAHGHAVFGALVHLAADDPGALWIRLGNRIEFDEAAIAIALTAGIARGLPHSRFLRLASRLDGCAKRDAPGPRPLPPLRRLLWAVAVAVGNLEAIDEAGGWP
jgi:hypothetical protein